MITQQELQAYRQLNAQWLALSGQRNKLREQLLARLAAGEVSEPGSMIARNELRPARGVSLNRLEASLSRPEWIALVSQLNLQPWRYLVVTEAVITPVNPRPARLLGLCPVG